MWIRTASTLALVSSSEIAGRRWHRKAVSLTRMIMSHRFLMQHRLTACRRGQPAFFSRTHTSRASFLAGLLAALLLTLSSAQAVASPTPQSTIDTFVASAFSHLPQPPQAQTLWLTPQIKSRAKNRAGFAPDGARIRYWQHGARTAWVLERIGKEAPITFGVIVEGDAIAALQVLTYRESRGFEIQSPRWLAQFAGVRAAPSRHGLDKSIDNISGATLSVRAGRDVTRLALFLHGEVIKP